MREGREKPQIDNNLIQEIKRPEFEIAQKDLHAERGGSILDYCVLELLGTGSYSTVYLARALNDDNKQVAIKIFDGNKKSRSTKDEILILKKISHP